MTPAYLLLTLEMIMKKLGLATAVLLAMTGAHAFNLKFKVNLNTLIQLQTIKLHWYCSRYLLLKNVDASKGPLAEAAFLNQASNVSVAYNYIKYDEKDTVNVESHTYGIKGEAYVPTPYVPVYASASYTTLSMTLKMA